MLSFDLTLILPFWPVRWQAVIIPSVYQGPKLRGMVHAVCASVEFVYMSRAYRERGMHTTPL